MSDSHFEFQCAPWLQVPDEVHHYICALKACGQCAHQQLRARHSLLHNPCRA